MPQVVRTVNDVIINALYLIGELGVGDTPDGFMLSTGLDIVNELLDKFSSDSIYIPYLTTVNFTFTTGKDTYSFSDIFPADITSDRIIDLSFANYTVPTTGPTTLIYPLRIINKAIYWGVVRQSNLLSRPGFIYLDKQPLESFLTVYPVPDQPYPCTVQIKVMLNALTNQDQLTNELPPNYYGFLKYAVGQKFCGYYPSANWTPMMQKELDDYYETFKAANETDITIRPSVVLTAPEPFNWPNILSF